VRELELSLRAELRKNFHPCELPLPGWGILEWSALGVGFWEFEFVKKIAMCVYIMITDWFDIL